MGLQGCPSGSWPGLGGAGPEKATFPDNSAAEWISGGKLCAVTHRPEFWGGGAPFLATMTMCGLVAG